jgi:TrmH RNA methyltransferase
VVASEDLERLARSQHHEGVVFDVLPRAEPELDDWLKTVPAGPLQLVWLVGVGNPHNFGAMLRAAANFGVAAVLLAATARLGVSGAAARVAEGGAEVVPVVRHAAEDQTMLALRRAGFTVIATSSRGAGSLHSQTLPQRVCWMMGAEGEGLPGDLLAAADRVVAIPGTGAVESLNVAGALAVLLSEHWRQHQR